MYSRPLPARGSSVAWAIAVSVLLLLSSSANARAASWKLTYPPYSTTNTVPYGPLNSIAAASPTDVWAVGEINGVALLEHYNGTRWRPSTIPPGLCSQFESDCALTGVGTDSAGDAITLGRGLVGEPTGWQDVQLAYRWTGSGWSAMTTPSDLPPGTLQHVVVFGPDDAWAAGGDYSGDVESVAMAYWNGTQWTTVTTPFSTTRSLTISAISGSSDDDLWVVGKTETGNTYQRKITSVALHYDGASWTRVHVPDQSGLLDVDSLSPTDAWAVASDGGVLSWNGSRWNLATTEPTAEMVQALSPSDVWVGGEGSIGHFNGSSWSTTPTPKGVGTLLGGTALGPHDVWFSGLGYPPNGDEVPLVLSTTGG